MKGKLKALIPAVYSMSDCSALQCRTITHGVNIGYQKLRYVPIPPKQEIFNIHGMFPIVQCRIISLPVCHPKI
jgi:hypothetical protein